jgi:predicted ATPase
MRIDRLEIRGFRNLRDFKVDFNQDQFATVLIGGNGTGKSNLIEAKVLIFRQLDIDFPTPFDYQIDYYCRGTRISATANRGKRPDISVGDQNEPTRKIAWSHFARDRDLYLPKYVFAYYSGPSPRLQQYFVNHQSRYYNQLLNDDTGVPPPIRRLFYCLPEHSRWVLLAYFLHGQEPPEFLRRFFGIDTFDSALLVLKRPHWAKNWSANRPPPVRIRQLGDDRFWWSRGVVKTFLQRLWDVSLAPIRVVEPFQDDYRQRAVNEEHLYLYLPRASALQVLSENYPDEASLFGAFESTEISSLVRDVRVRVKRSGESIIFSELSEGEQQLLTVVGLMQFTRHEESLFLLDEPDTHLNPIWKIRYLDELARQAGLAGIGSEEAEEAAVLDQSSQLILTTHDPLTMAGLSRFEVLIFERLREAIMARHPDEDPRGMGVAGVLLRLFGLPTTLDPATQAKIEQRNILLRMDNRTDAQQQELSKLSEELYELGLAYDSRDPVYRSFLQALHRRQLRRSQDLQELPLAEQDALVDEILDEILAKQK